MVSGLSNTLSGEFLVLSENGINNPQKRNRIGYLIENPGIYFVVFYRNLIKCKVVL